MVLVARQRDLADLACRTAMVWSARCGSPCRGSSPRTRRRRRRCCMSRPHREQLLARRRRAAPRAARRGRSTASAASALSGLPASQHARGCAQLLAARARAAPARARAACSRARCRRSRPGSARAPAARSASGACCGARRPAAGVPSLQLQAQLGQARQQRLVQRGHAVVVEARGHGAEHRHLVGRACRTPRGCAALLAHVAQRVGGALAVELVDRDEVGEVEHVDLLELARGAELRRHHVQRHVDVAARSRRRPGRCRRSRRSTRSKPAALQAAITSGSACEISLPASRVASERMKTRAWRHGSIAFMRMRSPSSAPPRLAARRVDRDDRDAAARRPGRGGGGGSARR